MCHSAWREEKRYRCQREGEKFGDKMREVRERERERERERDHLPSLSCFILFPIK